MGRIAVRPTLYTLDVEAANGTPFRVLVVPPGVTGPNRFRAPADRGYTLVEFYDRRYDWDGEHGQFTAYYRLDALMEDRGRRYGLDLQGGVTAWTVDGDTLDLVLVWLAQLEARGALDKR